MHFVAAILPRPVAHLRKEEAEPESAARPLLLSGKFLLSSQEKGRLISIAKEKLKWASPGAYITHTHISNHNKPALESVP